MKLINYLLQFLFFLPLFIIFKLIGYKNSSNLGAKITSILGPMFRKKTLILKNLDRAFPDEEIDNEKKIKKIWENYGRILSDYIYLKDFRNGTKNNYINVEGREILNSIKKKKSPVVFVSGHFNNFELMAMEIEKNDIKVAAIYRPLNNLFLNPMMENIRKKYVCKRQIRKGISGTREILKLFKNGVSIALMIDQRVSEGKKIKFFNHEAYTTTIPAQLIKKFGCDVIPVHIERNKRYHFNIKFFEPISFDKNKNIMQVTLELNKILEKMILKNPDQWIWTHNRWK
jgi:KDO2-lipid IV(A) lauroyltransferase